MFLLEIGRAKPLEVFGIGEVRVRTTAPFWSIR